ncbi:MAG TPA: metallophosphoesterase family protein, partial [Bacteroidota bacterium]|nr:metallophosphoesterase family protein [Bacteroidota bacterium]
MKIAIVSDIHANIEALNKALEIVKTKGADEIVCLGDTVGYGASPNECVELIRATTDHVLLGNHDAAALDARVAEDFNPYAKSSAEWTALTLIEDHKKWMRKLPYTLEIGGVLFVHSSPYEPQEWHYILSPADAQFNFNYFAQPICFLGHSHVPGVFSDDIWTKSVMRDKRFIVNVGSVGQPRDNDPRLSFGIFDTDTWEYENVRSAYDVKTASEK